MLEIQHLLPPQALQVLFVLFLSFLVGLEREEHQSAQDHFFFGGVRTFPLIGLLGYIMAMLSGNQVLPEVVGFCVIAAFLLLSYWNKLKQAGYSGITSHMSGLTTYVLGALVYRDMYWMAMAITVINLLLLELKDHLESLARRLSADDVLTFTKFLLLAAVISPLLPDQDLTVFHINPFRVWLVVIAVSTVSYGSYVLRRLRQGKSSLALTALLGGAYSSTVTTVALARQATQASDPRPYAGAVWMSSGVMYLRLAVLLGLFNSALLSHLAASLMVLGLGAILAGTVYLRHYVDITARDLGAAPSRNPLELSAAFFFAVLFMAMLVATHWVVAQSGANGVYGLAALMGVSDVDPFILGLTQSTPGLITLALASKGILIAAASNNAVKGIYVWSVAPRVAGRVGLLGMLVLALAGLVPLLWL